MANTFQWYLCPYDITTVGTRTFRTPAISRFIPSVPNADSANWDEAEILGNHVVVKVFAPDATHTLIQAEPDFFLIPVGISVPNPQRNAVRTKLNALGYTDTEINGTGFVVTQLLALLTTAAQAKDVTGALLPTRRPAPKTVAQIEARLPG